MSTKKKKAETLYDTEAYLQKMDAYFRAANYLSACQLYLLDDPLLKEPLKPEMIKKKIVGHWGTVPGHNFVYTHLNRVIKKYDLDMILLSGPGHGGTFTHREHLARGKLQRGLSERQPRPRGHAEDVQAVFVPGRRAEPLRARDSGFDQ